jgi:hypothetical protein
MVRDDKSYQGDSSLLVVSQFQLVAWCDVRTNRFHVFPLSTIGCSRFESVDATSRLRQKLRAPRRLSQ